MACTQYLPIIVSKLQQLKEYQSNIKCLSTIKPHSLF